MTLRRQRRSPALGKTPRPREICRVAGLRGEGLQLGLTYDSIQGCCVHAWILTDPSYRPPPTVGADFFLHTVIEIPNQGLILAK